MIIGITGSSGSGKSSVSKVFKENGFHVIDLDMVSRNITSAGSPCLGEITESFGSSILLEDGRLNRRALGEIVFNDSGKLKLLNEITHKYILKAMEAEICRIDGDVLIDAPLLFEDGVDGRCDFCIGVVSDRPSQIKRISARDGISEETAAARLDKQKPNDFYIKRCRYVIENNSTGDELVKKAEALLAQINAERML